MTVSVNTMHLLRIHYWKLLLLLIVLTVLFVLFRQFDQGGNEQKDSNFLSEKSKHVENNIQIDSEEHGNKPADVKSQRGLVELMKVDTCPLCFGNDLCDDVDAGFLSVSNDLSALQPATSQKLHFDGFLGNSDTLSVKTLGKHELRAFDDFVCKNGSRNNGCLVTNALKQTFLYQPNLVTEKNIQNAYRITGKTRIDIPLSICTTSKFISMLEGAFDENDDNFLSQDEKIVLFSTVALNPEVAVLKVLKKSNFNIPFPRYVGACGRMYVTEGDLTPLADFLDEPFEVRASLGAQLLAMVDDFQEDDPDWLIMHTDFSFNNIAVNKDGEVILIDVGGMAIVDKSLVDSNLAEEKEDENEGSEACNVECFQKFTNTVFHSSNRDEVCYKMGEHAHLMYALICQQVLSDIKEHKAENFFNPDNEIPTYRETRGLLHTLPEKDRESAEELLKECVTESGEGGRIQAAEELRDYLSDFVDEEQEDEGGEVYDEDEEDNIQ